MPSEFASIPEWNTRGVLPPCKVNAPTSAERSPYCVRLLDLVLHFAASPARREILLGYLEFRRRLHEIDLVSGFQWLNGSFAEDIERLEERPPRDIDVVTFYRTPEGQTQESLFQTSPALFTPSRIKQEFHVDGYFQELGVDDPEYLVERSTYWSSVWSHRRGGLWKGFLQVDLSPNGDEEAWANLNDACSDGTA